MNKACHWIQAKWVGKEFDKLLMEDTDVRDERDRVDAARGGRGNFMFCTIIYFTITGLQCTSYCTDCSCLLN